MIKNNCNHTRKKHTEFGWSESTGMKDATYICEKCETELSASDVFQLEILNHTTGFQRKISIGALISSGIAIVISIIALTLN